MEYSEKTFGLDDEAVFKEVYGYALEEVGQFNAVDVEDVEGFKELKRILDAVDAPEHWTKQGVEKLIRRV